MLTLTGCSREPIAGHALIDKGNTPRKQSRERVRPRKYGQQQQQKNTGKCILAVSSATEKPHPLALLL
jgi:hypothetical protein